MSDACSDHDYNTLVTGWCLSTITELIGGATTGPPKPGPLRPESTLADIFADRTLPFDGAICFDVWKLKVDHL